MKLRLLIAATLICAASALPAQEIKLTTAEWDSLAIPLGLAPFYLTVNSPAKATTISLELDLYINGKFSRKIHSVSIDRKGLEKAKVPLDVKCAITFAPGENKTSKCTVVLRWDGTGAGSRFVVSDEEFPIGASQGGMAASNKIFSPGRTAVFAILAGGGGTKFVNNIEELPKENPEASVMIGYLKAE